MYIFMLKGFYINCIPLLLVNGKIIQYIFDLKLFMQVKQIIHIYTELSWL